MSLGLSMLFRRDHDNRGMERSGTGDTRRHPRVTCSNLYCNLGRVLDLCPTGARVVTDRRPPKTGTQRQVLIETGDGVLPVPSKVVWTQRLGLGRFLLAVAFDPGDEASRMRMLELYNERRDLSRRQA